MVVGFNHNFRYSGVLYHVQTEDGGIKNPVIITHLFTGGTILSSRKTSYADIVKSDRLEQVVEELMKEQHREMLRRLRDGELDRIIKERLAASAPATGGNGSVTASSAPPVKPPAIPPTAKALPAEPPKVSALPPTARKEPSPVPAPPADSASDQGGTESSLDDLILSYLLGEGGKK